MSEWKWGYIIIEFKYLFIFLITSSLVFYKYMYHICKSIKKKEKKKSWSYQIHNGGTDQASRLL